MTRRIIVALDESPASLQALKSAARLAAEMSAEIFALFIEESDLFSVAALPFTSMVSFEGAQVSPLDVDVLARGLRLRARRLREDVARIAGDYHVSWQFQVTRGRVRDEILKSAESCEMIAIGASSRVRMQGFGSNVSAILNEATCSVLVFQDRAPATPRIAVMSEESSPALEIGASLARTTGAATFERIDAGAGAFDRLMRLAPSHVVTDRASLAKLGVSPQALVSALALEALIVTGSGNP